jgi:F-type H+-transporting ATPase subunit delta
MKIAPKQYAQILYELTRGRTKSEASSIIKDFAKLVARNNDIAILDKIIGEFEKIWNREQGLVHAEVVSAKALDKTSVKKIHDYIIKLLNAKQVELTQKIDENLLGGAIVKYGDKVLDGSLKTKLSELGRAMAK